MCTLYSVCYYHYNDLFIFSSDTASPIEQETGPEIESCEVSDETTQSISNASVKTRNNSSGSEMDPTLSIGLRDSLRSSTSSYHSAYSTRYFKAKMEAAKANEDERIASIKESENESKHKKGDNEFIKESKFSFMGRKFRELSKIGKSKNIEKENVKKDGKNSMKANAEAVLIHTEVDENIYGVNELRKEPNNDKLAERSNHLVNNEELYGLISAGNELKITLPVENTKSTSPKRFKIKNPNLKLSDCPPLVEEDLSPLLLKTYTFTNVRVLADDGQSSDVNADVASDNVTADDASGDEWEDVGNSDSDDEDWTLRRPRQV